MLLKSAVANQARARFNRLAMEGGWIVLGQIASVLGSVVLVRVLTEHLDPAQYGHLSLALTLGTLVCQMAFTGAMPGIMRYYTVAAEKGQAREYFIASGRLMSYGTIAAFVLGLLLLIGVQLAGNQVAWVKLTLFAVIFAILGSYNTTLNIIQNAARRRHVAALHSSLDAWLKILFAVVFFVWLGHSAETALLAYIQAITVILLSQFLFIRKLVPKFSPTQGESEQWGSQIWRYSKPFVLFNFFTWAQSSSDRWALELFSDSQSVGLYSVLMQLGYTPIIIFTGMATTLIGPIFFGRAGDANDSGRNRQVHKLAWRLTTLALIFTLMGFCIAFLLHDWIFEKMVAKEYRSVSFFMPWMVLAGGLFSAGEVLSLKLMSDMNTRALIRPKVTVSIVGALLSFFGARFAGLQGVICAIIIQSIFQLMWLGWLNRFSVFKSGIDLR